MKHDRVFMEIAKLWSKESYCERGRVGCVIVKDEGESGTVISHGYNGTLPGDENKCEGRFFVCPKCGKRISCDICDFLREKKKYKAICPSCKQEHEFGENEIKVLTKDNVIHAEENAILRLARLGRSAEGAIMYVTASPCVGCAKKIILAGIKKVVYLDSYKDCSGLELLKNKGVEVVCFNDKAEKEELVEIPATDINKYVKTIKKIKESE